MYLEMKGSFSFFYIHVYIRERERDLPIMPIKIHTTSYGPIKHTVSAVIELYQLFVISLSKTHT